MTSIARAQAFAETAHDGQIRKGRNAEPYIAHVAEVAAAVAAFGGSDEQVVAAWLHDTVEDCGVTLATLAAEFGAEVAALVAELTDDKSLPKAERKRLQIVNAPGKSQAVALVKICDKMSNVRTVADSPPVHWSMERRAAYLDWAETVVNGLPVGLEAARRAFAATLSASRAKLSEETLK